MGGRKDRPELELCALRRVSFYCPKAFFQALDVAQPKNIGGLAFHLIFHRFSPFNCCLSVVL